MEVLGLVAAFVLPLAFLQVVLWRNLSRPWFAVCFAGISVAMFTLYWVNRPKVCPEGVYPCQSHGEDLDDMARAIFAMPLFGWVLATALVAAGYVLFLSWRALDKVLGPNRSLD
jgi:hypothetical protein